MYFFTDYFSHIRLPSIVKVLLGVGLGLIPSLLSISFAHSSSSQRIVTLAPHATELIYSLGIGDRIIATVEYSDYPEQALSIPRLGRSDEVSIEAIVALQPDLVIAWEGGNSPELLNTLEQLGIEVYRSDTQGLESVSRALRNLGRLTGTQNKADQLARQFLQRLSELTVEPIQDPPRVFFQLWESPLMTANHSQPINDIIERCGGVNLFSRSLEVVPQTSVENVVLLNPDVILAPTQGLSGHWRQRWEAWQEIRAVQAGHLYTVDADLISRPTLRILEGMEVVCRLLDRPVHTDTNS